MYFEPLSVEPSVFQAMHATIWPRIVGGHSLENLELQAAGSGQNSKVYRNPYSSRRATQLFPSVDRMSGQVVNDEFFYRLEGKSNVAVIPIYGVLAKNAGLLQQVCMGFCDINPIAHAVNQAAKAKDVSTIVLDIASPGGQVKGIRETASAVRAAAKTRGKTVYAFSDENMASSAYYLGSQANEIYVTPSATVGSIGTYLAWLDPTMKLAMEGLKLEFFGAGQHKGMGLPGKPLSEGDRVLLQATVDEFNGWFTSAVQGARPKVVNATMQGQSFSGERAVGVRLADGICDTWDEFIDLL